MCVSYMQILHHVYKGLEHPWILVTTGGAEGLKPIPCKDVGDSIWILHIKQHSSIPSPSPPIWLPAA